MDFGEALKAMKSGKKIRRSTWTDGAYLILGTEEQYGKEIFNYHSNGQDIDCIESMTIWTDALLAEDWEVIEDLQEVNVITETVEYYICPVCKNKIRLQKNAYTVTCITCKFSVLLKRD